MNDLRTTSLSDDGGNFKTAGVLQFLLETSDSTLELALLGGVYRRVHALQLVVNVRTTVTLVSGSMLWDKFGNDEFAWCPTDDCAASLS